MSFIFKTANIFWNILVSTYWTQSIRKNDSRDFCLFGSFQSYNGKSKFSFLQTMQSSCNTSYLWTSHFCVKCLYRFLPLIFLYALKKIPWKNYVRFWKWNLKCTPQSAQNSFSRKSNLNCYIILNIRQRLGLSKDQTSMFKSFLIN